MVIDLRRWLDEHREKVDREQELVVIHRDTVELKRETVMHANHQLLTQIKILQEAQQRVIELGTRKIQADSSSEAHQHPTTPTNLHVKLNVRSSKLMKKSIIV